MKSYFVSYSDACSAMYGCVRGFLEFTENRENHKVSYTYVHRYFTDGCVLGMGDWWGRRGEGCLGIISVSLGFDQFVYERFTQSQTQPLVELTFISCLDW